MLCNSTKKDWEPLAAMARKEVQSAVDAGKLPYTSYEGAVSRVRGRPSFSEWVLL